MKLDRWNCLKQCLFERSHSEEGLKTVGETVLSGSLTVKDERNSLEPEGGQGSTHCFVFFTRVGNT